MKHLKRLQAVEKQLTQNFVSQELMNEFSNWMKEHPVGGGEGDHSFKFDEWIDGMPKTLVALF